jgi:glutathione S-transferase
LNDRLSGEEQKFVALKDRPTLADLSYFPFAMPWMFTFLGVNIHDWPHVEAWSKTMLSRPAIEEVLKTAPTIGH